MAFIKGMISLDAPAPFLPSQDASNRNDAGASVQGDFSALADTNVQSTASFRYDPPGTGFRSSQQINVDFSHFENHTFFNSAEVNVNVAFDRIINEYPFDGTRKDIENFIDSLTGFEKWVFDNFPKNRGYLFFSGALGTSISVNDFAGSSNPTLSTDKSGRGVIDPRDRSLTFEMQLFLPQEENGNQIIAQKLSGTQQGVTICLLSSSNLTSSTALFAVASGSNFLNVSASLRKGQFNHLCATFDRSPQKNKLFCYLDGELVDESKSIAKFDQIDFRRSPLTIGSGSYFLTASTAGITPTQTLSGALDELRVFHAVRTPAQQKEYASKVLYAGNDLVLYFKFNEPTGTLGASSTDKFNRIVLDSSGNSLHSFIDGFDFSLRSTGSLDSPMSNEKLQLSPVLFPHSTGVLDLNSNLLSSASSYDAANPNLITRLVPAHYFNEGEAFDGLSSMQGSITDGYTGTSIPGTGKLGSTQLFLTLLYTYAKFFDELKITTDAFSNVLRVNYDADETVVDNFLLLLAEHYGFKMPGFFSDASISQFIDAENLGSDIGTGDYSLRYIQDQLLRRILTNMRDIISSKGTRHAIGSLFRSLGIDPDTSIRMREFGGAISHDLAGLREKRSIVSSMLNMSASLASIASPYLSSSRVEPADSFPPASVAFVTMSHDVSLLGGGSLSKKTTGSPEPNDGLLTSGSWTYEAIYKFPFSLSHPNTTQSLVRMFVTGDNAGSSAGGLVANLVAISSSITADRRLSLYLRSGFEQTLSKSPLLQLDITGSDIFDGNRWHVSFGRRRNDEFGSDVSSSYFLRMQRREPGDFASLFTTQSYFDETTKSPQRNDVLERVTGSYNASGSFLLIGSSSIAAGASTSEYRFLNSSDIIGSEARANLFQGKVARVRFWSRALDNDELNEHARNFESLGADDPAVGFNFNDTASSSFGRLRLDVTMDQPTVDQAADSAGNIRCFDFSQNAFHMPGTGFEKSVSPFETETFKVDAVSTVIDEATTDDKIRVRSFQDFANVAASSNAQVAPIYSLPPSEIPLDDVRFSIDFSIVDALNRDIALMLSTLDEFDSAIGSPNLMYSDDYPRLSELRDIYFNRLERKINIRGFQEFFKWVDTSIGDFILQILPRKTHFLGMNFTIENSLLERAKKEYRSSDSYVGPEKRDAATVIELQQVAGSLKRY